MKAKKLLVPTIAAAALLGAGPAFAANPGVMSNNSKAPELMDMNKISSSNGAAHTITLKDGRTLLVPGNISLGEYRGSWTDFMYHKRPDGKLVLDQYFVDGL